MSGRKIVIWEYQSSDAPNENLFRACILKDEEEVVASSHIDARAKVIREIVITSSDIGDHAFFFDYMLQHLEHVQEMRNDGGTFFPEGIFEEMAKTILQTPKLKKPIIIND